MPADLADEEKTKKLWIVMDAVTELCLLSFLVYESYPFVVSLFNPATHWFTQLLMILAMPGMSILLFRMILKYVRLFTSMRKNLADTTL